VVDSYIKQLRQKLEDNSKKPTLIITVHGFGYKLEG
ncbi:MAG: helix-turn-helix domain-containing protein, partial [Clostridiales bacterium]|jgi:DNA-binding response OmpR family regulator|nr:helix-turn-helix domain-containing protein [Clostridiales bacterium]